MKNNLMRFILAIVLASAAKELVCIYLGILPVSFRSLVLCTGIFYYFLGNRLPTNSNFLKGILLGLLVTIVAGMLKLLEGILFGFLAMTIVGAQIHNPMNILLSIPYHTVFFYQAQNLLPNLAMAIVIALIIKPKNHDAP